LEAGRWLCDARSVEKRVGQSNLKSAHFCRYQEKPFSSYGSTSVTFLHPVESLSDDILISAAYEVNIFVLRLHDYPPLGAR
jgi:hypothetical protein